MIAFGIIGNDPLHNRTIVSGDAHILLRAPVGAMTPELSGELMRRKADLISLLSQLEEAAPAITPMSREISLPLWFAQERLWILDQLEPGNDSYSLYTALALHGCLGPVPNPNAIIGRERGEIES